MAYAAITKSLLDEVRHKLDHMADMEVNAMADPSKITADLSTDPEFRARLVDKLWEPVADLRGRLEQYNKDVEVNLKVRNEAGVPITEFKLKGLSCPLTAPISKEYYGSLGMELVIEDTFHPKFAEYVAAKADRKEAQERWKAVKTQVVNFLNSCKSANEALKLWPDVERYIPKETVAKVNQKSEKAVKEESSALAALKAINIEAVNTSTVLARMAGAKV